MFQDSYVKLDKNETKALVESLQDSFDGGDFDPASTIIMARELPFYNNSRFLDIADHRMMPPSRRFVILMKNTVTVLDFTNSPIYELNADVPIALNEKTVIDYVRFFFTFVRGRHGRFIVVESIDDIPWREEPAPTARKAVGKMISPISLISTENGAYHMQVHMMFKDSLFQALVDVTPDGQVKITQETLMIEDIPVIDDTLGQ